jgi:hypothetical protein
VAVARCFGGLGVTEKREKNGGNLYGSEEK